MKKITAVFIITACLLVPGMVKVPAGDLPDPGMGIWLTHNSLLYAETGQSDGDKGMPPGNSGVSVLYRVMAVVLVTWLGLALYLFLVDRKIKKLEKSLDER